MQDIRYSDDVKEAISLAERLAKKAHRKQVSDHDYLLGLFMSNRKFSRLDALLDRLKLKPSKLKQELTRTNATTDSESAVLENAGQFAKSNAASSHAEVDVEHYLKAGCLSPDPQIQKFYKDNNLSPEHIDVATQEIKQHGFSRSLLYIGKELAEVVVFVLVFLVLIKSFLGELRLIPSESMVPGLQIDDRLVIERVTHHIRPYQRGDVLVFYPPMTELKKDPWSLFLRLTGFSGLIYKKEDNIDVAYIKRLIGTPGDTVNVRPGIGVFVNGEKLDEPYISEIANTCTFMRPTPYCGPITVPSNSYYLMGDNRNLSLDSRYWGFASEERVIGRAVFRIWPLTRVGPLKPAPYQQSADTH